MEHNPLLGPGPEATSETIQDVVIWEIEEGAGSGTVTSYEWPTYGTTRHEGWWGTLAQALRFLSSHDYRLISTSTFRPSLWRNPVTRYTFTRDIEWAKDSKGGGFVGHRKTPFLFSGDDD
jgi:hypothetical protein